MEIIGLIYLSTETVLKIHEKEILRTSGVLGVRNKDGLESAVSQPRITFGGEELYRDIFMKAAVLAFGISQGQVFVDGNKRTGLLSALVFLDVNGIYLKKESEELYLGMIGMSDKSVTKEQFAEILQSLVRCRS